MKKFMKVLMSCLVTCMVIQPLYAYADTVYTEGYLKYVLENESISICGYFGSEKEVTIPSSIAGYPVSKIAKGAFTDSKTVEKLILPDTIMTIEEGAIGQGMTVVYDGNIERVPTIPEDTEKNEKPATGNNTENNSEASDKSNTDPSVDNNTLGDSEAIDEEIVADLTEDNSTKENTASDNKTQDKDTIISESGYFEMETRGEANTITPEKKSGVGKIVAMIGIPIVVVGAGVGAFFLKKKFPGDKSGK